MRLNGKNLIEKNKTYPKSAKRRGIEGKVNVSFLISQNGEFLEFTKLDGKKTFYKSVKKTITALFPLHPPKNIFNSTQTLSLVLEYKLY